MTDKDLVAIGLICTTLIIMVSIVFGWLCVQMSKEEENPLIDDCECGEEDLEVIEENGQ